MAEGQDLTKGNISKELWNVAWPMMLSIFFYTLYSVVNTFWSSKLSSEAIAAVSISQITIFLMASLSMGITVGSGVLMAMNIGAKNIKEAERILGQSFVLSCIAGVIFTAVALLFREQLLMMSGASGAVVPLATSYFTITAAGSILFYLLITIMFAFNSQGDTFTLTKLFALSTLINALLDPLMIFGYQGFVPAMGIQGAAYATLISQAIFILIAIRTLQSPKRKIRFHFSNLTFSWPSVKKVLAIGVPASLSQVINPVGTAALMFITALGFHEAGTVAFSLGFRVEFFAFLPAIGFGFGAMAMMGQSIGAGDIDRARQIFKLALKYSFFAAAGLGILAALFAGNLIGIFTTDPVVMDHAQLYMWTVALSYGFLAATMVEASAFQAIGRSWPGFWIAFLRFVIIAIPLSYITTQLLKLPISSIWLSLVAANVISATVGFLWIRGTLGKFKLSAAPVHH